MSTLLFCGRWLLFALLFWGACSKTKRVLQLHPCFSPIVTACTLGVVVYFGGLLGGLRLATYGALALCALCTVSELFHWKRNPIRLTRLPLLEIAYLLCALAFAYILAQGRLVHYDNFTHWAVVVKEMLITHAFPTAETLRVEFTNYPTGTASWIYLVCTVVGNGENCMILAQGILIFAGLYAVFGVIRERGRFLLLATLGTGLSLLSLFNLAVRINNLLVDFLLPVLTLAALALIYRHRDQPRTLLFALTPLLGLLTVVKSTGVLFAGIALLYALYALLRHTNQMTGEYRVVRRAQNKIWRQAFACLVVGALPYLGWMWRMRTEFAGVANKFETDLTQVATGIGDKTPAQIQEICQLFCQTLLDVSQRATLGVLLFHGLALVACIIGCGILRKKWALPTVLVLMDLVLVAYLAGILAMYLFSMPLEEALYLAAFDRYAASIVVLYGGVLSMCLTIDMENSFHYQLGEVEEARAFRSLSTKSAYLRGCVVCLIAISLILTSEYNGMQYQEQGNQNSLSQRVQAIVGDNWTGTVDPSRYLVFASDAEGLVSNYYVHYVARYYLRANQVDAICLFYEDNFENLLSQYDYLVIVDSSTQVKQLMQKYLGLSGEVGIYDLQQL